MVGMWARVPVGAGVLVVVAAAVVVVVEVVS
jgi:hypothetical protein